MPESTHRCEPCGRTLPASAFSKRQLSRRPKACKACVQAVETAEQHVAASREARATADGTAATAACSTCGQTLPRTAFSRTQVQKTDATRRCVACVASSSADTSVAAQGDEFCSSSSGRLCVLPSELPAALIPCAPSSEPRPEVEIARLQATRRLRRNLSSLCAEAGIEPPLMAFDRWMARSKLSEPSPLDPLLPAAVGADEGLVKDLCRTGGAGRTEAAAAVALQLAEAAGRAIERLKGGGGGGEGGLVEVHVHGALLRLSLSSAPGGTHVDVSHEHYAKLAALHAKHAPSVAGNLRTRVLCMLLRYQSLGAHGNQCALPPSGFEVLRQRLGITFECFASPLNARYDRYCSAFADTDAAFGSIGSFFGFRPTHGSFECNPPFVPEAPLAAVRPPVLLAAVKHAEALLSAAEASGGALSFAFVVPSWERVPFHQQLCRSAFLRGGAPLRLAAEAHGFVDGAQHLKAAAGDRLRVSSFASTVGVLQTAAAAERWPVDAALYSRLSAAFAGALPSAEAAQDRMRRGGGDAVALLLQRRAQADAAAEGGGEGGRSEGGGEEERPPSSAGKRKKGKKRARGERTERTV